MVGKLVSVNAIDEGTTKPMHKLSALRKAARRRRTVNANSVHMRINSLLNQSDASLFRHCKY